MEEMVDTKMMEQLNESMRKLEDLEKKQGRIINETSEINQKLRQQQSKKSESLVKKFFEELKKDVESIQAILSDDKSFLNAHEAMQKTSKLLEKESTIKQEIQSLGQKPIDSSLKENLADNFTELNDRRRQLTKIVRELNNLRTQGFQELSLIHI